jgi:hypothetical protein
MTENEELELELELAKAKASAKKKKGGPATSEVVRQAAIRGPAAMLDAIATGVIVAPQMVYGAGATALGRPDLAPNIEKPITGVTDYFTDNKNIPEGLNLDPEALEGQTAGQKILGTAVEGATTGLAGRGKQLANMALAGAGAGAGEAVSQATDNPLLGIAASVVAPSLATRAIPALNIEKRIAQATNAQRDRVLEQARRINLAYVPEGRISDFADRPKLLEAVAKANTTTINNIAKRTLGIPETAELNVNTLEAIRQGAINRGYLPLRNLGRFTLSVDPNTGLRPYDDDLLNIRNTYSGSRGTFPGAVPRQLDELIDPYIVADMDANDVVDKIRQLRREATKALRSDATTPEGEQLAYARQEVANALENELERQAVASGSPEAVEAYRAARRQIAISHLVEDSMEAGSEVVSPKKLGKLYERGSFMTGDLATAGAFFAMNFGSKSAGLKELTPHFYKAVAGYAAADAASKALGLSPELVPAVALSGAAGFQAGSSKIQEGARKYLMSGVGQSRNMPNYDALGTEPALPALSGLSYFNSMQEEQ